MDVKVEKKGRSTVIRLYGSFMGDEVEKVAKECDKALEDLHPDCYFPIFDFAEVTEISAKGFRYLLRLKNKYKYVMVIHAIPSVFDAFSRAGMLGFIDVYRIARTVSEVEGLQEKLKSGSQASVIPIDDERVIKVFDKSIGDYRINHMSYYEWRNCLASTKLGVPCVLPLEMIKLEENYGILYERLGDNLAEKMSADQANVGKYIDMWVNLAKDVTSIEVDPNKDNLSDMKLVVEDIKRIARDSYDEQDIIGEAELDMIDQIFASIPDRKTYCHGDNHCGNILLDAEDNPRYIDFPYTGYGHPIFDMYSSHMLFCGVTDEELNAPNKKMFFPRYLFNADQCHLIWDKFVKGMTGSDDPEVIKMTEEKLTAIEFCIHIIRGILYNKYTPDPEASKKMWLGGAKKVMSEHIAKGNPKVEW